MEFDPYASCPCGSGKKFKWCCQPVHIQIGKAFEQDAQGQHEMALKMMDAVCAEHFGNPEAWGRKAQLLFQMNRGEEADNALEKAFAMNPNYPFGLYLRGRFRHLEGEIPGALLLFRRAVEVYDAGAHDVLGHIFSLITDCEMQLNRPVAARAALELAVKELPANAEFRKGLEQAFGKPSRLPAAARQAYGYRDVASDSNAPRRELFFQARRFAEAGKFDAAAKTIDQLLSQDSGDSAMWFNLGLTKAWQGDNLGSVEALDRSVLLDQDEARAAATWSLAEVLLCGHGLAARANFVEHTATFPIRDPDLLGRKLNELHTQRRFIGLHAREQEGVLTGVLVEQIRALTPELAAGQPARLAAFLLIVGDICRLWNVNKQAFDGAKQEIRQLMGGALGDPYEQPGPARFEDLLAEGLAFPVNSKDEAESKRIMSDFFVRHFEEKWIHKPLRTLQQLSPKEAAANPTLRKKLLGHIQFLADCGKAIRNEYDFDQLRRILGLLGGSDATLQGAGPAIGALSAAELANLGGEALSDDQLEEAFQTALKLSTPALASQFAKSLLARPPRAEKPDRYSFFNHLAVQALADGQTDAALEYVNQGEKTDSEHNEGKRRNDYQLKRGQILVKRGEFSEAGEVFDRLTSSAPAELRYFGAAAEAMLSGKQGARAKRFAEGGLQQSRAQNNRDSEQYFLELVVAANKAAG